MMNDHFDLVLNQLYKKTIVYQVQVIDEMNFHLKKNTKISRNCKSIHFFFNRKRELKAFDCRY